MKTAAKIPLLVLVQALGIAVIVGIPVLFVASSQIRRACGSGLFGSRQHFCTMPELWRWLWSLPSWGIAALALAIISAPVPIHRVLRRLAS